MEAANSTSTPIHFDNKALSSLPLDTLNQRYPRSVRGACFSLVEPTPVKNPKLVAISKDALINLLGFTPEQTKHEFIEKYFSGNEILPGSQTASHCYCGYQFGYFSGQLGDGAAIYLGEVINHKGERWEIQLKGAGLTPYSRTADGRKVLRSSIREFLCSEASHFLGIPTTRAGSVVTSDSVVLRDPLYSGKEIAEKCSIVLRIAQTFMRFGSFEIFKPTDPMTGMKGPSYGLKDQILPTMLDYTISTFFPEIYQSTTKENITERYEKFFREVVERTAKLVACWQAVGFCHGVLNTDNMSIVGLTLDYGPFGFMDSYDSDHICNTSDHNGRYSYKQQPAICRWNCAKLGEALEPLLPLSTSKKIVEDVFDATYKKHYLEKMRNKLGLIQTQEDGDEKLIESFFETLESTGGDFTCSFRSLSLTSLTEKSKEGELGDKDATLLNKLSSYTSSVEVLINKNKPLIPDDKFQFVSRILQQQPEMLQLFGIDMETVQLDLLKRKKLTSLKDLLGNLEAKKQSDENLWRKWLLSYRKRLSSEVKAGLEKNGVKCDESVLQNPSLAEGEGKAAIDSILTELDKQRTDVMNKANPMFILRNHTAQRAIEMAEQGDFSEVNRVLEILQDPFAQKTELSEEILKNYFNPPSSNKIVCVSCSS